MSSSDTRTETEYVLRKKDERTLEIRITKVVRLGFRDAERFAKTIVERTRSLIWIDGLDERFIAFGAISAYMFAPEHKGQICRFRHDKDGYEATIQCLEAPKHPPWNTARFLTIFFPERT